jgi:hypothetical protein
VPEHDAPMNATIAARQTNERRMRIAPFCLPRRIARGRGRLVGSTQRGVRVGWATG